MARSPLTDFYPTKVSGRKLTEEEIAYYEQRKLQAQTKKTICGHDGCNTSLAKDNKTGKCSIHGGSSYKNVRTRRYHREWKKEFFNACNFLRQVGLVITKENLDTVLSESSLSNWLNVLKRQGYITVGENRRLYTLSHKEMPVRESKNARKVVQAMDELILTGKNWVGLIEIEKQSGLSIANTKSGIKVALERGYLEAKEPSQEVVLTERGEKFTKSLG